MERKNNLFLAILLILLSIAIFYSVELNSLARPIVIAGFFIYCGIPKSPYKSRLSIEIISCIVMCEGIILLFGGVIQMIKIHHQTLKDILLILAVSLLFLLFGIFLSILEFQKYNLRKKRCFSQVEASYVGYRLVQTNNYFTTELPKELLETPYITTNVSEICRLNYCFFNPVYSYFYEEQEHTVISSDITNINLPQIGTKVHLYINPNNPEDVLNPSLKLNSRTVIMEKILAFLGIIFIISILSTII